MPHVSFCNRRSCWHRRMNTYLLSSRWRINGFSDYRCTVGTIPVFHRSGGRRWVTKRIQAWGRRGGKISKWDCSQSRELKSNPDVERLRRSGTSDPRWEKRGFRVSSISIFWLRRPYRAKDNPHWNSSWTMAAHLVSSSRVARAHACYPRRCCRISRDQDCSGQIGHRQLWPMTCLPRLCHSQYKSEFHRIYHRYGCGIQPRPQLQPSIIEYDKHVGENQWLIWRGTQSSCRTQVPYQSVSANTISSLKDKGKQTLNRPLAQGRSSTFTQGNVKFLRSPENLGGKILRATSWDMSVYGGLPDVEETLSNVKAAPSVPARTNPSSELTMLETVVKGPVAWVLDWRSPLVSTQVTERTIHSISWQAEWQRSIHFPRMTFTPPPFSTLRVSPGGRMTKLNFLLLTSRNSTSSISFVCEGSEIRNKTSSLSLWAAIGDEA